MDENKVRAIIRDELRLLLATERYTFQKHIQMFDGRNIQTGRSTGTIIATEGYGDVSVSDPGQKLGFFGTTPVIQPATVSDPSGGATVDSQARGAINSVIDVLQLLGLMRD